MLDISDNNIFFTTNTSSNYAISKVLEFYDIDNINWIFLCKEGCFLKNVIKNNKTIKFEKSSDLKVILRSHLFRVDLIVVRGDFLEEIRKYSKLPVIVVSTIDEKPNIDLTKYQYLYEFSSKVPSFNEVDRAFHDLGEHNLAKTEYYVRGNNMNTMKLEDIRLSKIRDRKINIITN